MCHGNRSCASTRNSPCRWHGQIWLIRRRRPFPTSGKPGFFSCARVLINAAADGIRKKRRCCRTVGDDLDLFIKQSGMAEFQKILYERLLQRHEEHFTAVVIENHAAWVRQQLCPARFCDGPPITEMAAARQHKARTHFRNEALVFCGSGVKQTW